MSSESLGIEAGVALTEVALGNAPADLVLHNGKVVNVFTGDIEQVDIAISHGRIAALGHYEGVDEIDLHGRYVTPGFIDAHVHLESSHVTPNEYARAVIPHGTVAVVADPHELANIGGLEAVRWFIADAAASPLTVHTMAPSCVPASPFETPGFVIGVEDIAAMRDWPGIHGLAEVMNFPGVLSQDPDMLGKLATFAGGLKDGHAPGLSGADLCAYVACGIISDHESVAADEAREKLSRGMYIGLRQGSSAQNLRDLLPAVDERTSRRCMLVDDDRSPADLFRLGHLNNLMAICVAEGIDPVTAIQMVTLNPSEYMGRSDLGAIAPGRRAHLAILDDLIDFHVDQVLIDGKVASASGETLWEYSPVPPPSTLLFDMQIDTVNPAVFAILASGSRVRIIVATPASLYTTQAIEDTPVRNGYVTADPERDISKIAVLERHHRKGTVGLGLIRGLQLRNGALASTMAHDAHNLIVCGTNDNDMATAANHLIEIGGGFAIVANGQVIADIPMPIGGIVSDRPFEEVAGLQLGLRQKLSEVTDCPADPFDTLQFMALTVIPELKICDQGLIDVSAWSPVNLFA